MYNMDEQMELILSIMLLSTQDLGMDTYIQGLWVGVTHTLHNKTYIYVYGADESHKVYAVQHIK